MPLSVKFQRHDGGGKMSENWEKRAIKKAYGEGYDDGRIEAYSHIVCTTKACLKVAKEQRKEFRKRGKEAGK